MRIVYVSQYFPPEMGAPAARVHEFARRWVEMGHEVTVITGFPQHPLGVKRPEDRRKITRRDTIDGIDVIRTYIYATPNAGTSKRMFSYSTFMASAMTIGPWRIKRPDVLIATSPQLLCGVAGYAIAKLRRCPFVFEVRDLWPESVLAVGAMDDNFIIRRLKGISRFLYNHSRRIVTVGEGYREGIVGRYGIDPDKIDVIHNGIDPSLFNPAPRDNDVRKEFGWGDKFVVMYIGTHGMAHGLGNVLDSANLLRDRDDILFTFVGEGAEKARLKEKAAELSLTNVQFIDQQPKSRVPEFYAAANIGLVSLRNTPLFQEVLPSKIFEYLGMERPILINLDGEARKVIERAGCGWYVEPGNPQGLADAVADIRDRAGDLDAMGKAGRAYVLEHYNREVLAERYVELLKRIVGGKDGGGAG